MNDSRRWASCKVNSYPRLSGDIRHKFRLLRRSAAPDCKGQTRDCQHPATVKKHQSTQSESLVPSVPARFCSFWSSRKSSGKKSPSCHGAISRPFTSASKRRFSRTTLLHLDDVEDASFDDDEPAPTNIEIYPDAAPRIDFQYSNTEIYAPFDNFIKYKLASWSVRNNLSRTCCEEFFKDGLASPQISLTSVYRVRRKLEGMGVPDNIKLSNNAWIGVFLGVMRATSGVGIS